MTAIRPPAPARDAAAPSALGAFLRGVDRRGLVFARLLSGGHDEAREGLAWALERFAAEAGRTAFGDWPRRFWSMLLAAPTLRRPAAAARWEPAFDWLAGLGHGPRAALLLRLVAGLAESDAAAVLGIARPTYRLGLQRALPHRGDGSPDIEAWQALGRAAQAELRAVPAEALAPPGALPRTAPGPAEPAAAGRRRAGRGVRTALWIVALATLAAFAATFVARDHLPDALVAAPGGVLVEPLPPEAPAGRYDASEALALHPDLGLLLDAGTGEPAAADPAFHAWFAVQMARTEEGGEVPEPAAGPGARGSARPPAERLPMLDASALARLEQRRAQWDALPAAERGEARERWLAWNALDAGERATLRVAAATYAALDPERQAAERARFDALDASERHGWLLGPALGADYPRLHALVAQVPEDVRLPLLEALRGLDRQARDDLAVLAARTPPQERAALRIELLAMPAEQRARWLRTRVSPPPEGALAR